MRTIEHIATFTRSFTLAGLDAHQPPGSFVVLTDEEELPGVSYAGWRRIDTRMRLPAIGVANANEQWVSINPNDLMEVLMDGGGTFE